VSRRPAPSQFDRFAEENSTRAAIPAAPPNSPETDRWHAECRRQLKRIADSVIFSKSEQLQRLLLWLGDKSLEGGELPSEGAVGTIVMRRNDFDPQSDSIVRKEMGRLRDKLNRFYQTEGARDPIRVVSSRGYLVEFEKRTAGVSREGACRWLILPIRSPESLRQDADYLAEDLLFLLSEDFSIELIAPTTALSYRGRIGDIRNFASECQADFAFEGSIREHSGTLTLTAWLVDGQMGITVRSCRLSGSGASDLATRTAKWLLDRPEILAQDRRKREGAWESEADL